SRDKAILLPEDMKGLKTRGAGKMIEVMLQAAGASISTFPSNETYNAMQSGVVDALWTSSASLMSFRLQEVAKYVTTARDHTFWYMFEPLLMSKATYDKLTPEQQKIVHEVGQSLQKFALDSCKADDKRVADVYGQAGMAQRLARRMVASSAWGRFSRAVKALNALTGHLAGLLILASCAIITNEVVWRYYLHQPHTWNLEVNI